MISFMKKSENLQPPSKPAEDNRFEQIRKTAAERHKKSDTDGSVAAPDGLSKTTVSHENRRSIICTFRATSACQAAL